MFRVLNADEEKEFRQWARENYCPLDPILEVWHPVVRDECAKINSERIEKAPYGKEKIIN